jgi:hypothetical protein
MKLVTPDQVPRMNGLVCRQSRSVTLFTWALLLVMVAGIPVGIVLLGRPAAWFSVPLLLFATFMAWKICRAVITVFNPANWLLQIMPDGLWINLRSYQNANFPPAPIVLFVPYSEIAGVSEHRVKRAERMSRSGNKSTWTDRYLDIRVREPAIPELDAAIDDERRRRITRELFNTGLKSHSRSNHVPVTLPNDSTIRVAWRGKCDYVVPSLSHVLDELIPYCWIDATAERDLSDLDALAPEEIDRLILESVESGDTIGAMKLLQDRRGYTLTDAKTFVDELRDRA